MTEAFPVLALDDRGDSTHVVIAWSQHDSVVAAAAERSRPNIRDPKAQMPLPSVGNTHVLLRAGIVQRTASAAVANASNDAFRPTQVGDVSPQYATAIVAGARTGDSVRVGEGSGAGLTLVNVWATWCVSCLEEMADLDSLHRDFSARGLTVVAVSVDQGDAERVRRFAERERLAMSIAHDPEGRVQTLFGVVGVPETYLIDANGKVLWKTAGNVHGVLGDVRAAISRALPASVALHR
jgi:peroxiredoxin